MVETTGRAEAERTMALLWGTAEPRARGPRPGLSVEQVVATAIELADAEGIHAVSMRRIAERLGVGTMSLYTYVPGKAELLELMLDRVVAELLELEWPAGDWRAALDQRARADWDLYHRHPWLLRVNGARAVLGPNVLASEERTLSLVAGLGLTGREMVGVTSLLACFVRSAAQAAIDAATADETTGVSEDEWWYSRAPILEERMNEGHYPTLAAIEAEGAFAGSETSELGYLENEAVQTFEFGLERILDGIELLIRRQS